MPLFYHKWNGISRRVNNKDKIRDFSIGFFGAAIAKWILLQITITLVGVVYWLVVDYLLFDDTIVEFIGYWAMFLVPFGLIVLAGIYFFKKGRKFISFGILAFLGAVFASYILKVVYFIML